MELLKTMRTLEKIERALKILSLFNSSLSSFPTLVSISLVNQKLSKFVITLHCYGEFVKIEDSVERIANKKDDHNEDKH